MTPSSSARLAAAALAATAVALAAPGAAAPARAATPSLPAIHHVVVVELENEDYTSTFVANPNPYLPKTLPAMGVLLRKYYGTGHESLDNYITQISGQAPNPDTQADCQNYIDVLPGTPSPAGGGQVNGIGCVYPSSVLTLPDQLAAAGLSWKGYMEDMGNDPTRDNGTTCAHPPLTTPPASDPTQTAAANDQYATRHNPFMYFHSIIDNQALCSSHVVPLAANLARDFATTGTPPNFSFITPNLCDDGHDALCTGTNVAGTHEGGLKGADLWLQKYVPVILGSPAMQQDGMLIVTFDESGSDKSACCGEPTGPNTISPGIGGAGGGDVGTVIISPFTKPGTTSDIPYNHYSMLRSLEDLFGITTGGSDSHGHLGYAGMTGLATLGADVYSRAATTITTLPGGSGSTAGASVTGLANTAAAARGAGALAAALAGAALLAAGARRRRTSARRR